MLAAASRVRTGGGSSRGRLCSMMRRQTGSARLTCEHCCDRRRGVTLLPPRSRTRSAPPGDGDALGDVRAGFAEEGKNSSFGGCIRTPTGDLPGPTVPASAPPLRKGLVHPQRTSERRVPPSFHSQYMAHRGACGKTRLVPHNRPSKPEPREMGGSKCVCCCRRMGRAWTSNQ